jgi:hypothetical protein
MEVTAYQSLKWINRHGAAVGLLALILVVCVVGHSIAVMKVQLFHDLPCEWNWGEGLLRNMAGIRFVHGNGWAVLVYLLFAFGTLLYLEVRTMPRWAVSSTFMFLSLPMIAYVWLCLNFTVRGFLVMGHHSS